MRKKLSREFNNNHQVNYLLEYINNKIGILIKI